jgi:RNA polymerase sigma-70 factor (sigma-E family)
MQRTRPPTGGIGDGSLVEGPTATGPGTGPGAGPESGPESGPADVAGSSSSMSPEYLHARYFRDLVRTAALMTDDRFLAEEIVQDAFAGLVARWGTVDPDRALAYLYRAVANGARSALRRRRTVRAHPPDHAEPLPGADAAVLRSSGYDSLLRAVAALPRRQRDVLVLRYYSELSVAETAAALGLSAGAVTTAAHRAITALSRRKEELS